MKKLWNYLCYCNDSKKAYKNISREIEFSNWNSINLYSTISCFVFLTLILLTVFSGFLDPRNLKLYIIFYCTNFIIGLLNYLLSLKYRAFLHFSICVFFFSYFILSLSTAAYTGKDDITCLFMVFLFAFPLLLTLRPLVFDIIIIISDIIYIVVMNQVQSGKILQINITNAVIFGFCSLFTTNYIQYIKFQKLYSNFENSILMNTDTLTKLNNRASYHVRIDEIKKSGSTLGIVLCVFDVNCLKKTNDTYGHHAGDLLIIAAAECIDKVFSPYGKCFRTGGDEFIAILTGTVPSEEELKAALKKETEAYVFDTNEVFDKVLSVSIGIENGDENTSIVELVKKADKKMYADKTAFYQDSSVDRRKS